MNRFQLSRGRLRMVPLRRLASTALGSSYHSQRAVVGRGWRSWPRLVAVGAIGRVRGRWGRGRQPKRQPAHQEQDCGDPAEHQLSRVRPAHGLLVQRSRREHQLIARHDGSRFVLLSSGASMNHAAAALFLSSENQHTRAPSVNPFCHPRPFAIPVGSLRASNFFQITRLPSCRRALVHGKTTAHGLM